MYCLIALLNVIIHLSLATITFRIGMTPLRPAPSSILSYSMPSSVSRLFYQFAIQTNPILHFTVRIGTTPLRSAPSSLLGYSMPSSVSQLFYRFVIQTNPTNCSLPSAAITFRIGTTPPPATSNHGLLPSTVFNGPPRRLLRLSIRPIPTTLSSSFLPPTHLTPLPQPAVSTRRV